MFDAYRNSYRAAFGHEAPRDRLAYLAHGLAVVLAFIGVKLIMEAMQALWIPTLPLISTGTSLLVIVGVLTATGLASYAFAEKDRL